MQIAFIGTGNMGLPMLAPHRRGGRDGVEAIVLDLTLPNRYDIGIVGI